MKRRALTLCIAALLLVFAACGTNDAPAPQVSDEPQISETPTTAEVPDELLAAPDEVSAETTAKPQPSPIVLPVDNGGDVAYEEGENTWTEYMFSDMHPIVYDGLLLGGSYGDGMWIDAESVAEYVLGTELYNLYAATGLYSNGFGTGGAAPNTHHVEVREFAPVDMNDVNNVGLDLPYDVLAISASWDAMPRLASAQSLNNATYTAIVKDALKEYGLDVADSDIKITQHFRLDFEGDGVDEVVIYAESPSKGERHDTYDGAYSVMILRKFVNGKVENIVMHVDVHHAERHASESTHAGNHHGEDSEYLLRSLAQIVGFVDLNGDGRLEIITQWSIHNSYGYSIFEILPDGPAYVMGNRLDA